jgi:hypothetical protein
MQKTPFIARVAMGWEDMDMEKFYHDQKKKERDCE